MKAYLTEKHSQAAVLAQALGGHDPGQKRQGFYETSGGYVVWAAGHLLRLKQPEEYSEDLKAWSFDTLPFPIRDYRYCVDTDGPTGKIKLAQYKVIQALARKCDHFVIATDNDREGEVIGRLALEQAGFRGVLGRLVFSAIDVMAFKKALQKERPASEFDHRYREGLARGIVDWVVGLEMTRASQITFSGDSRKSVVVSAGLVQCPVLALVDARCVAIESFTARTYFEPQLQIQTRSGLLTLTYTSEDKIFDRYKAETLLKDLPSSIEVKVSVTEGRRRPPKLYKTNTLFGDAANKFGWTSTKTLSIANALYLAGHIVYPRSDCEYLEEASSGDSGILVDRLGNTSEICSMGLTGVMVLGFSPRSELYDDKKVTAHTAIIPNVGNLKKAPLSLSQMSDDERKLFVMIARRYIAAHLRDQTFLKTTVSYQHDEACFTVSGKQITDPGWTAFLPVTQSDEILIPADVKDQSAFPIAEKVISEKKTRPPAWYTEQSLTQALEANGFGKPATFAAHLQKLRDRQYVSTSVDKIQTTVRGKEVLAGWRKIVPDLLSSDLSEHFEQRLAEIGSGQTPSEAVIAEMRSRSADWVERFRNAPPDCVDISKISVSRPPTLKQKALAKAIARELEIELPKAILADCDDLQDFLETHEEAFKTATSVPSSAMLNMVSAIRKGNPDLVLTDEELASRKAVAEFIEQHREVAIFRPSDAQIALVKSRAQAIGISVPVAVFENSDRCRRWLDTNFLPPSPKQLALATKLSQEHDLPLSEEAKINVGICREFIEQAIKKSKAAKKKDKK
ncbi:DNA topoisomerase [Thalassospira marina]|uniref:DNA topoisomerase n=1 Tax=Thalassospira marina TaxID=2048283 RepID=A0A2N3KIJ9_9PROT|nr:DNA topoisomerase [Thalassospira marina]PKR50371.1 hypothetical protein COO20_21040 [Thalassospira marina]|tara:strand:+ start:3059 stop:5440 length:2382 start_codon:yes stop_codon:yes gene_type:complete